MALELPAGCNWGLAKDARFLKKSTPLAGGVFDIALLLTLPWGFLIPGGLSWAGEGQLPPTICRQELSTSGLIRSATYLLVGEPGLWVLGGDAGGGAWGGTGMGHLLGAARGHQVPKRRGMMPESLSAEGWLRCSHSRESSEGWKHHPNGTAEKPTQPNE